MNLTIEQAKNIVENKIKKLGFTIIYRKNLTGRVFYTKKICYIPEIKTRNSLYIGTHELYHCLAERKDKVFINEYKAEKFAHRYLHHLGFSVPRKQTKRAKRYIEYKIRKASYRGLLKSSIPKEITNYIN